MMALPPQQSTRRTDRHTEAAEGCHKVGDPSKMSPLRLPLTQKL